jgi:hypothetical protein
MVGAVEIMVRRRTQRAGRGANVGQFRFDKWEQTADMLERHYDDSRQTRDAD